MEGNYFLSNVFQYDSDLKTLYFLAELKHFIIVII